MFRGVFYKAVAAFEYLHYFLGAANVQSPSQVAGKSRPFYQEEGLPPGLGNNNFLVPGNRYSKCEIKEHMTGSWHLVVGSDKNHLLRLLPYNNVEDGIPIEYTEYQISRSEEWEQMKYELRQNDLRLVENDEHVNDFFDIVSHGHLNEMKTPAKLHKEQVTFLDIPWLFGAIYILDDCPVYIPKDRYLGPLVKDPESALYFLKLMPVDKQSSRLMDKYFVKKKELKNGKGK